MFGATWLLPDPKPETYWGSRCILDSHVVTIKTRRQKVYPTYKVKFYLDFLHDRQGSAGEKLDALFDWLNKKAIPEVQKEIEAGNDVLCSHSSSEIYCIDQGNYHFKATPNASYGYVYCIAWIDDEKKEEQD